MKISIFKNVSNHQLVLMWGQITAKPQETFSAPTEARDVQYLLSRGLLKHMKEFDTETKEARPEVLNKDTWDMI
jgi:hypothetical protein